MKALRESKTPTLDYIRRAYDQFRLSKDNADRRFSIAIRQEEIERLVDEVGYTSRYYNELLALAQGITERAFMDYMMIVIKKQ